MTRIFFSQSRSPSLLVALLVAPWVVPASAESTDFEKPAVSGTPEILSEWDGSALVSLQSGTALVQDSVAASGAQSLELAEQSSVMWQRGSATPLTDPVVTSFQLSVDTLSTESPTIPNETLSALMVANASGLMALDGDGNGSGTWSTVHALTEDTFFFISITRDYAAQTYDLSVDDQLVADDFGFKDTITSGPSLTTIQSSSKAWIDDIQVSSEPDNLPPTPDPIGFATPPTPLGEGSITMTAVVASDRNGVEYEFQCTAGGGNDSGWQDSPTYRDDNLASGIVYRYRVRARDQSLSQNATGYSPEFSATVSGPAAPGTMILHEPFDYSPPNGTIEIGGLNGGTGFGGPWSASGDNVGRITAGLAFNGLPGSGGALLRPTRIGKAETHRPLSEASRSALLPPGATVWFSILLDSLSGDGFVASSYGSMVLSSDPFVNGVGSGSSPPTIITAQGGNAIGIGFDTSNSITGLTYKNGAYTQSAGLSISGGTTTLIAGKITWDNEGTDRFSLYHITNPGAPLPDPFATMTVDLGQSAFTTLAIGDPQTAIFDEIRFGHSFAAVMGRSSGPVIEEFAPWITQFGLAASDQGINDDPDGDGLQNGLEAWLGTHPGVANPGLEKLNASGTTTTFSHSQSPTPLLDLTASYQWSTNLSDWHASGESRADGLCVSLTPQTVDATTTVSAVATTPVPVLFLRLQVVQN